MNKEVIYLEPEDDITDILTKLQQASQKLVALVPPKKGTMLRSAVNMKLVSRVARECEKIVVVVTADPAIVKVAMATRIPVAKTLNSRPVIPTEDSLKSAAIDEQVIEEDAELPQKSAKTTKNTTKDSLDNAKMPLEDAEKPSGASESEDANVYSLTDDATEKPSKSAKKGKLFGKKSTKGSDSTNFFVKYKKYFQIGVPAVLILVIVLVWALVFAPAATITVAISSSSSNFSENVHFTTDPAAEDAAKGTFLVEEQTVEQKYTTDFSATGEEDQGDHATGSVNLQFSFTPRDYEEGFTLSVAVGETFVTTSGQRYLADEPATISWNGDFPISCSNGSVTRPSGTCILSVTMPVTAEKAGDDYNISAGTSWKNFGEFSISNSGAISGGTSHIVKIVSEDDVNKAVDKQLSEHRDQGLKMLKEDLKADMVLIDASFKADVADKQATPAVGDAVGDNTTPNLTVTIRYTAYAVEQSKIDEYIKARTELASDQQIYSISDAYFDRYTSLEDVARLKAVVETGPIVTEDVIFDKAHGRKVGEVQSQLRSINGVSSVNISTSFFWVNSIPNNRDKVTISIEGGHPAPTESTDNGDNADSDGNNATTDNTATSASSLSSDLEGDQ